MEAVILAGGRGTRLRPITDYVPKPLVPVNNRPILEWQIGHLVRHDITKVVVCAGYMSEQITGFLEAADGLGADVQVSIEDEPLGTGGALRNAAKMLSGESFYVLNGDVITDMDLARLDKAETVAAIPLRTRFGVMSLDGSKVDEFREKGELSGVFMNAGVYRLSRGALDDMPERGDMERTVLPRYAKQGRLNNVRFDGALWHSIDSFKDLEECARAVAK
ncbi:nucleoside-diphosphate-sugar pyrophosphorylase [Cenarchaeum symbiosum A]|uniref:Nucleoside-diphosphate-sugar pyrophosphorylase n=1 Tax=Cenarchaeum symbiosum (strain A) TaxID=414004 RepID=A0RVW9_CENSY|nr:nucleoside-diphosphate-sugar pyrophosphorylase [Cenarchaeum symbiosum A]